MKHLLLSIAILIGAIGMAQNPAVKNNQVVIKGKILAGEESKTRIIVKHGFETVIDKKVGKSYRLALPTHMLYDVTFINNGLEKHMIINEAPEDLYLVKLDIDFAKDTDSEVAVISYDEKHKDYTFSILEFMAAKAD